MFDRIIEQTAGRFGLSTEKTKQLLGALIALIFNEKRGGPAGFLQAFRSHGLGDVAGSWLGDGPRQPISAGQLDSVLGAGTLGGLAAKLGLPADTVGSAAATMLPDAIGELSENGQLPTSLPDRFRGWFGDIGDFLGDIGGWGTAALGAGAAAVGAGVGRVGDMAGDGVRAVGAGVDRVGDAAGAGARAVGAGLNKGVDAIGDGVGAVRSGTGKLWPWLLLAALAIAAFLLLRGCKEEDTAATTDTAANAAAGNDTAAAPAERFDSKLSIARNGGKVAVEGTVDSEASKTAVIDALNQAYGAENVTANITVDPNARAPGWLTGLAGFLPGFTADGATLSFDGNKVDLSGNVADTDRAGLLDKLKAAFGGFSFGGLFGDATATAGAAMERSAEAASAALDKLTGGGQIGTDELVKALNLMPINFETASARITADSAAILEKAATAIKAAPAGTRIEVGGHTDSDGNDAANQSLSEARAAAVVARLGELGVAAGTLTSKGYGEGNPIADNTTAEGKARNRRIEFKVLQ